MRDLQFFFGGHPVVEIGAVGGSTFEVQVVRTHADVVLVRLRLGVQATVGPVFGCTRSSRTRGPGNIAGAKSFTPILR